MSKTCKLKRKLKQLKEGYKRRGRIIEMRKRLTRNRANPVPTSAQRSRVELNQKFDRLMDMLEDMAKRIGGPPPDLGSPVSPPPIPESGWIPLTVEALVEHLKGLDTSALLNRAVQLQETTDEERFAAGCLLRLVTLERDRRAMQPTTPPAGIGFDLSETPIVLPDGSAFATASYPLPKDHWQFKPIREEEKPLMRYLDSGNPAKVASMTKDLQWAIRSTTNCGKIVYFDPDAMVQNLLLVLFGRFGIDPRDEQGVKLDTEEPTDG